MVAKKAVSKKAQSKILIAPPSLIYSIVHKLSHTCAAFIKFDPSDPLNEFKVTQKPMHFDNITIPF